MAINWPEKRLHCSYAQAMLVAVPATKRRWEYVKCDLGQLASAETCRVCRNNVCSAKPSEAPRAVSLNETLREHLMGPAPDRLLRRLVPNEG